MNARSPMPRRVAGNILRRYRERAGRTLQDAAATLECDVSKISRIETGQRGVKIREMRELLTEYGADEETQSAAAAIAAPRGWWQSYEGILPDAHTDYLALENSASRILIYEAQQIPTLLQIPDYSFALADCDRALSDDARDIIAEQAILRRKFILGDGTAGIHAIIGEAALRQRITRPAVMRTQIRRVLEASDRVTVQVLPFSNRMHPAPWAGSLAALHFDEVPGLPGVACQGSPAGGIFLDSDEEMRLCGQLFADLRAAALPSSHSLALLHKMAG